MNQSMQNNELVRAVLQEGIRKSDLPLALEGLEIAKQERLHGTVRVEGGVAVLHGAFGAVVPLAGVEDNGKYVQIVRYEV